MMGDEPNTGMIWFVTRDSGGSYCYWEQEVFLDDGGYLCSGGDYCWDANGDYLGGDGEPLHGSSVFGDGGLQGLIDRGIDPSLSPMPPETVAAGWLFDGEPDWHRHHRLVREGGAA